MKATVMWEWARRLAKEHLLDMQHFLRAFISLVVGCFKMFYMKIMRVLGRMGDGGDNRKQDFSLPGL